MLKTEKQIAERINELSEKYEKAELKLTKMSIKLIIDELLWVLNK
jgi:hypothetical protein